MRKSLLELKDMKPHPIPWSISNERDNIDVEENQDPNCYTNNSLDDLRGENTKSNRDTNSKLEDEVFFVIPKLDYKG